MLDLTRSLLAREENIRAVESRIDEQLAAIEKAVRGGGSPRRNLLILGALITMLDRLEDEG
jgi:hypothetical protein